MYMERYGSYNIRASLRFQIFGVFKAEIVREGAGELKSNNNSVFDTYRNYLLLLLLFGANGIFGKEALTISILYFQNA